MAGNWKLNLNHHEAVVLVQKLAWTLRDKKHDFGKVEVAVLPPFTDLRSVQTLVDGDQLKIGYGAQDVSHPRRGRLHRRDLGRHADQARLHLRRRRATPSGASTTARTTPWSTPRRSRRSRPGMTPIVCVGEGLDVRQAGEHVALHAGPARRLAGRA